MILASILVKTEMTRLDAALRRTLILIPFTCLLEGGRTR